jgi:septum formation protein
MDQREMDLWRASAPLVLASSSAVRRAMIEATGIPVEVRPAGIDERALEQGAASTRPEEIALLLAKAKAIAVAAELPRRLVVGADQTLALGARRFTKPADRAAARAQLLALRGRTHMLHSAIAVAEDGVVLYQHCATARMTMRRFSDDFLECYLDAVGAAVTATVGAYQLERTGVHLFERIEGDHFTILGLPLLPLLAFLRSHGLLA